MHGSGLQLRASAILFDMDGVLVDSRAVIERVLHRWAAHRGIDSTLVADLPHGQKTSDTIRSVAPHLDLREEVAWLDAEEERDLGGITAVKGAADLLASLPPDRWALVTSAGRELAGMRMAAAGLPLPRWVVSGESVARGKPAPDAYLLGAERVGRAPASCVVFEDAPAGVAAGIGAGMRVVGLATTYPGDRLNGCVAIVPDLSAVSAVRDGDDLLLTLHSRP
jgi:mannitol-1-/sugar-/sorbitol-6-phosphatase